jgi:DNA-binding helix-turn-helix protein
MEERLKILRKHLGLSREDFAKKLGLKSRGKIENIELGRTTPDDDFLKLICNTYNVSYGWLVNGNDEMFQDDGDAQAIVDSVMTGDNEFAKKILVKFVKLSDEHWKQLQEILTELENN